MNDRLKVEPQREPDTLLLDVLVVSAGLEEFLNGLVEAAASLLSTPGTDVLASVTLLRPRTRATTAGSCTTARRLADIQGRFDDGPCLRAAATGRSVSIPDSTTDSSFPIFGSAALRDGIRSCLGVPVRLDGPEQAAIVFYSSVPGTFSEGSARLAELFAARATTPLILALRLARLAERADHLSAAMESRTTIDLAVGVIMAQNRCSQEEAVEILRAASSARNIKLRDLASKVLTSMADAPVSTHFQR